MFACLELANPVEDLSSDVALHARLLPDGLASPTRELRLRQRLLGFWDTNVREDVPELGVTVTRRFFAAIG